MLRRFTSSRIRKERKKRLLIKLTLWAVLCAALLFLAVEVVHLKQLRIERVRFEGNTAIRTEDLWNALRPYVEGEYAYLFSKKNIFVVPTDRIEKMLEQRFVRLKDVDLYREGLHTLVVESVEREPVGIWCLPAAPLPHERGQATSTAQTGDAVTSSGCYYLDDSGLAFAPAPNLLGTSFITYEQAYPDEVIGEYIIFPGAFVALRDFIASLSSLGFQTYRATFTSDRIDLTVRGTLPEGGTTRLILKIPLLPPYEKAFSNLISVTRPGETDIPPLSILGIDYIDLRFEHKVFYKKSINEESRGINRAEE